MINLNPHKMGSATLKFALHVSIIIPPLPINLSLLLHPYGPIRYCPLHFQITPSNSSGWFFFFYTNNNNNNLLSSLIVSSNFNFSVSSPPLLLPQPQLHPYQNPGYAAGFRGALSNCPSNARRNSRTWRRRWIRGEEEQKIETHRTDAAVHGHRSSASAPAVYYTRILYIYIYIHGLSGVIYLYVYIHMYS